MNYLITYSTYSLQRIEFERVAATLELTETKKQKLIVIKNTAENDGKFVAQCMVGVFARDKLEVRGRLVQDVFDTIMLTPQIKIIQGNKLIHVVLIHRK